MKLGVNMTDKDSLSKALHVLLETDAFREKCQKLIHTPPHVAEVFAPLDRVAEMGQTLVRHPLMDELSRKDPAEAEQLRIFETFKREERRRRKYEDAVIQLATREPEKPKSQEKARATERSHEHERWCRCGAEIQQERKDKGLRPYNQSTLANEIIGRLGLHDAFSTVTGVLRKNRGRLSDR